MTIHLGETSNRVYTHTHSINKNHRTLCALRMGIKREIQSNNSNSEQQVAAITTWQQNMKQFNDGQFPFWPKSKRKDHFIFIFRIQSNWLERRKLKHAREKKKRKESRCLWYFKSFLSHSIFFSFLAPLVCATARGRTELRWAFAKPKIEVYGKRYMIL